MGRGVQWERTVLFFGCDVGATVFCLSQPPVDLPSREVVEVLREWEPARMFLGKCLGMGKEGEDMKERVCLLVFHFRLFVVVGNAMFRLGMSARVERGLGEGVLAVCNGTKFRLNDLVDVIVGTGIGVPGNKAEPFKGLFKGVVGTVRGVEFLVKPLVSGNGRSLQIPQQCVFKINAFGTCVLGKRTTRYFSALQPAQQERSIALTLILTQTLTLTLNLNLTTLSLILS